MLAKPCALAPLHAVCYDLSDDRERRRVDRLLKGYGFRAQKSVFECRLTRTQKQLLLDALQKLALTTGHVRVYRLQAESVPRIFGKKPENPDENFTFSI